MLEKFHETSDWDKVVIIERGSRGNWSVSTVSFVEALADTPYDAEFQVVAYGHFMQQDTRCVSRLFCAHATDGRPVSNRRGVIKLARLMIEGTDVWPLCTVGNTRTTFRWCGGNSLMLAIQGEDYYYPVMGMSNKKDG